MMGKIQVSDGLVHRTVAQVLKDGPGIGVNLDAYKRILNAFAKALAENPIEPTLSELQCLRSDYVWASSLKGDFFTWSLTEWQRRMFLLTNPMCQHCGIKEASPAVDENLCGPCWNSQDQWKVPEALRVSLKGFTFTKEQAQAMKKLIEEQTR